MAMRQAAFARHTADQCAPRGVCVERRNDVNRAVGTDFHVQVVMRGRLGGLALVAGTGGACAASTTARPWAGFGLVPFFIHSQAAGVKQLVAQFFDLGANLVQIVELALQFGLLRHLLLQFGGEKGVVRLGGGEFLLRVGDLRIERGDGVGERRGALVQNLVLRPPDR